MDNNLQTIESQSEDMSAKSLTNELNYEPSITVEVQISSNNNNNLGSVLIPGYLLVRSESDSQTYHLQQTVMQIDVESDHHNHHNHHNLELSTIELSTDSALIQSPVLIDKQLEPTFVITDNNNVMNNTSNIINLNINCDQTDPTNAKNQQNKSLVEISLNSDQNKSELKRQNSSDVKTDKKKKHLAPSRLARVNCPICDKEFKKTYIKEHLKIHDNHKPYKCVTCGKTYRWRTLLRNHKKTHLADNPFTCPVCELRMSSKFSLQQHILKIHENSDKKFECNECDKKYVTIHQLRAHQKFHSSDRTRQCEYCGKVYRHMASLERHRRIHKGEENSVDLRLKCSHCGLICHSKTHYTAHKRIHTGEKPFTCQTCGKTYRQIGQLNQHRIVHTDLRPFKCTQCDRTFRCRSNLQLHLDHHKGEKRHTCSHCNQKFYSYPNMLKHIRRNHLGLRPFKCEICENKSFCEKQELQNHMRTHTGEKKPKPKSKRLPLPIPKTS